MQANISSHDSCQQTWGLLSIPVLAGVPSSVAALTAFSQDVGKCFPSSSTHFSNAPNFFATVLS